MRALLFWLTGFLPCRFINDGDRRYLERYYLGRVFGLTFYIHRFVASDPDRGLHDHPWAKAWSVILSGWYFEERRTGIKPVKWFNRLTCESFHRVILPRDYLATDGDPATVYDVLANTPRECWTLFVHTDGRPNKWGFWDACEIKQPDGKTVGGATFTQFVYPPDNDSKKSDNDAWWKTTQPGRNRGRVPL